MRNKKNQDFIDDLYQTWNCKETEDVIEAVKIFFIGVMEKVEEYKSADMYGFSGITTELDGDGRKRKIKVRRDSRSIGNVNANYEVVSERKEKKKKPLMDKGGAIPKDYEKVAGFSKTKNL